MACLFILKLTFKGKEGVLSLTSAVGGKSPLRTLYVQGQSVTLTEPQMVEVCSKLATCLGILNLSFYWYLNVFLSLENGFYESCKEQRQRSAPVSVTSL